MTSTPSRRQEFWSGARNTIPLEVGGVPFGIVFGALATTGGLSPGGTLAMSAFVYAGSAQFIAAGLAAEGVAAGFIVLTTLVVNLRHMLYAATLAPHVKGLPGRWLLPMGFWLTDETFAVAVARYAQPDDAPFKHWYYLGSALSMYLSWQLSTLIGVLAGRAIPDATGWGLDFALVVTFIGLVVPMVKSRPAWVAALVAGIVALVAYPLPNKLGLMIAALAGVAAGLIAETAIPQPAAEPEGESA
jgi:4-azaleucine resistance transporter AzlC